MHFSDYVDTRQNEINVTTGEPDFLNPNSFANISEILVNLGTRAGITQLGGERREWLLMEVDGGIYPIIEQLVANVFLCKVCDNAYYGKEEFLDHICAIKSDEVIPCHHYFDWVVLTPGLLHWEINACKAFMNLNWNVLIMDIFQDQKFTSSPKALEYMRKCSNHHKAWKFLEILYVAATDELRVPFVRHTLQNKQKANVNIQEFWDWSEKVQDPNYNYLQHSILTYFHALMLFIYVVYGMQTQMLF